LPSVDAAGVGSNDPEAGALVRSSNIGRAKHSPFRIEPLVGQVSENGVESESKVSCDVLQDDVAGS
jgi:hypothetical protein